MKNITIVSVISYLFWICVIGSVVFAVSLQFVDAYLTPKWVAFGIGIILMLLFLTVKAACGSKGKVFRIFEMQVILSSICIVLSAQAIYGILQYFGALQQTSGFRVSGSYDNPAGFAAVLCAGLPFVMLGMLHKGKYKRYLHIVGTGLILVAIVLSQSRASLVALLAIFLLGGLRFVTKRPVIKLLIIGSLCIVLIIIFLQKVDSASGRLLIWNNTLDMVADRWLTGWGTGGFEAHYMDYQAEYFRNNLGSDTEMFLADNVQYPFNEYLYILTNYGVAGLLIFGGWIGFLICGYWKNKTMERLSAVLSIVSVLVFSMFSYPLMFPFVWFSVACGSIILLADMKVFTTGLNGYPKVFTVVVLLPLSMLGGWKIYERTSAEIRWNTVAYQCFAEDGKLSEYASLYRILGNDRYFLYNYAYTLYETGDYSESLEMAEKCRELWADYDVEMLIASIYEKMELEENADTHYQQAGYMCPNRFRPLYHRLLLYEKVGNTDSAAQCAKEIIGKPVKIPSSDVTYIKRYAEDFLINTKCENLLYPP